MAIEVGDGFAMDGWDSRWFIALANLGDTTRGRLWQFRVIEPMRGFAEGYVTLADDDINDRREKGRWGRKLSPEVVALRMLGR